MKKSKVQILGLILVVASVLAAVGGQFVGPKLVWIDRHPTSPPEIAAQPGRVVESATHISLALIPLAVVFAVGLGLMLIRKPNTDSLVI